MTRITAFAFLLSLMIASIVIIDSRSADFPPAGDPPPPSGEIYATGFVEGVTEDIQLRPEVAGLVAEVRVAAGDWVEAGAVLLRLDDRRQTQMVASSRANVELAEAQLQRLVNGARQEERDEARAILAARKARLDQAMLTWQRIRQLRDQGAVTQQEADDQQGNVDALTAEVRAAEARVQQLVAPARTDEVRVAQARVAAAMAEFELARVALDKTQVRAPHQGRVLDLNVERGEFVGPEMQQPVTVLSDTSAFRVRAFVEEIDAPRIKVGAPAEITADGLPDQVFHGHVSFLSPRMTAKTISSGRPDELYDVKVREVLVDVESDAAELLVGLRVDVKLLEVEQ